MITRALGTAQEQFQGPDLVGNVRNEEIRETKSEKVRYTVQLCCSSSPDVADLFEMAGSTAMFHLEVIQEATKKFARKIKYEAMDHCAKIREIALDEIVIGKKSSSEVVREYNQMISETIQSMEEQLNELMNCRKTNVSKIKNYVFKEVADELKKSLQEPVKSKFFDPKRAGALVSQCRKSVMTMHVFLECFFLFGAYAYASKFYL